ncbi:MAG: hypothetical protein RBU27_11830 [Bacteroidota bacterium]|jgi:hypothetical protein|nr:hypothetical protein [Bacteroidota bacterium]
MNTFQTSVFGLLVLLFVMPSVTAQFADAGEGRTMLPARGGTPVSAAPYESDILSARPIRYWLGLGPGVNAFIHQGSFSPNCACEFRDQDGTQPTFAGEFRVEYPKLGFAWSVLLGYTKASAEFAVEESRTSVVVGDEPDVTVAYRRTSDVRLQWLSVTPGVFWYIPRSMLWVRGGLEIGIPIEYQYDHHESIRTPGVQYHDGTVERTLLAAQDIPGGDRLRFAFAAGVGYDISVSPSIAITPRLGASLPLTTVSSTDDTWTVLTVHGLVMLNIRL